ncbi:hypothetical protein NUSPORA_01805 [Nucleospora cyclopteri]
MKTQLTIGKSFTNLILIFNRLVILQSIFLSITELPEGEWLRNAYETIRPRLGGMPRGKWKLLSVTFCEIWS